MKACRLKPQSTKQFRSKSPIISETSQTFNWCFENWHNDKKAEGSDCCWPFPSFSSDSYCVILTLAIDRTRLVLNRWVGRSLNNSIRWWSEVDWADISISKCRHLLTLTGRSQLKNNKTALNVLNSALSPIKFNK